VRMACDVLDSLGGDQMSDATTTISLFSRASFVTLLVLFCMLISFPAYSATPIYTWQDASGTIVYTDNPENAPSNTQVKVLSKDSSPQTSSETGYTQTPAPQLPETSLGVVTQGEFAIQLVEELGLADVPTAEEAADLLMSALISPRLGRWELNQPMNPELTLRLRKLAIAAAERGWIALSPEQVLLAFDTTSALLSLTIPETADPEEVSDSPYPIAEMPPLVSVEPPPTDIYPDYIWTPVAGGFWWGDLLLPGFFVLDVNIFFSHHHHFFFRDHRFGPDSDPGRIGRRFLGHIMDHHVVSRMSAL